MKQRMSKVTIVGAGPGDPSLLTIKAVEVLKKADVVLFDALANEEILYYAPKAIKLFVGKRNGFHAYSQDQINNLIVNHAIQYGHVVRLKGGDPFVFGRGKEEISFVEAHGIKVDVVPGITSAIAVPESVGIPVTLREVATSFWVITATIAKQKLSRDLFLAAQSSATVVILMGMSKLAEIVGIYKKLHKEDIPVAVIQNGTKNNERVGVGIIESIESVVTKENLSSPAVIVIGEVVKSIHTNFLPLESMLLEDEFIFQNLNINSAYSYMADECCD
ncbi:MAG: uroporphyrinogen-III C-methyltransferase [Bacteroidota bacterium]